MKNLQPHASQDLHALGEVMKEDQEQILVNEEREISSWLERTQDDLLDVDDAASMMYADFPPLPDFPCMSSSSSSSSTPAPVKAINASSSSSSSATSSSSAASWAVLKSDVDDDVDKRIKYDHHHHHQDGGHHQYGKLDAHAPPLPELSSTASMEFFHQSDSGMDGVDCMDVMDTFGYMDLLDGDDFFDPSSIFQQHETSMEDFRQDCGHMQQQQHQHPQQQHDRQETMVMQNNNNGGAEEDLALVFLEWLKNNKETVSAEDLRKVKIKKATIECAAKRLGGGKDAMKQLLKLILEWVQTNHLQKRRMKESAVAPAPPASCLPYQEQQYQQVPHPFQNPNPNDLSCNINNPPMAAHESINNCFPQPSPWVGQPHPPNYVPDQGAVVTGFPSMVGYMGGGGDPYGNGGGASNNFPPQEYHMLESAQSWPPTQFSLAASHYNSFPDPAPQAFAGYGNQYPPYPYVHGTGTGDQRLVRLGSSATKEARKKRMARQRRLSSHARHHNHHHSQQNQHQNQSVDPHARFENDNCNPIAQANPGNWIYWPPSTALAPPPMMSIDRPPMQPQNYQRQDKRQGLKSEKNLRFLLQKVLKQSDVGNLGRIVLPKKEAETHLPELEARDGISIAMEDIVTSRVWNMRYRFWPNNKSRMYLLENTGDFVKANGLQEGDFIVLYSDVKCGKYLIRGVKVRQPGPKSETKRPVKSQKNQHANSPAGAGNVVSSSSKMARSLKQ